jgi:hypothetical protein
MPARLKGVWWPFIGTKDMPKTPGSLWTQSLYWLSLISQGANTFSQQENHFSFASD